MQLESLEYEINGSELADPFLVHAINMLASPHYPHYQYWLYQNLYAIIHIEIINDMYRDTSKLLCM